MTADGGSSGRSPSWGSRATGVGSDSPSGRSRSGVAAGLELVEQLEDARAALGGVVELDVEVGDAPDAQPPAELVPHERHRPAERGDGRVALRGWPMTLTQTLRVAQVRRRLDVS